MFGVEVVERRPAPSQLTFIPHPQEHTSAVTMHTAISYGTGDREQTASGGGGGGCTGAQGEAAAHPWTRQHTPPLTKSGQHIPNTDSTVRDFHLQPTPINPCHIHHLCVCLHSQFLPGQAKAPSPKAFPHPLSTS